MRSSELSDYDCFMHVKVSLADVLAQNHEKRGNFGLLEIFINIIKFKQNYYKMINRHNF
jgi:hypothetical protein